MFSGISVTRRYVRFLFESATLADPPKTSKPSNEETVMHAPTELPLDTELMLPTTDDCHVGDDVG